jgi:predicted DNA-binding protein with PD1-like motif
VGVYDPSQKVYVTRIEGRALELIVAHGTIGQRNRRPFVHMHGLMTDGANHCTGGRLFHGTIAFSIDYVVQELTGPPVEWRYDAATGMQGVLFGHQ